MVGDNSTASSTFGLMSPASGGTCTRLRLSCAGGVIATPLRVSGGIISRSNAASCSADRRFAFTVTLSFSNGNSACSCVACPLRCRLGRGNTDSCSDATCHASLSNSFAVGGNRDVGLLGVPMNTACGVARGAIANCVPCGMNGRDFGNAFINALTRTKGILGFIGGIGPAGFTISMGGALSNRPCDNDGFICALANLRSVSATGRSASNGAVGAGDATLISGRSTAPSTDNGIRFGSLDLIDINICEFGVARTLTGNRGTSSCGVSAGA